MLAVVLLTFLASTGYAQCKMAALDQTARGIADNGIPSIQHLVSAREALEELPGLLDQQVKASRGGVDRGSAEGGTRGDRLSLRDVRAARSAIHREVQAYLALPLFPGEREQWQDVQAGLTRVDDLTDRLLSDLPEKRPAELLVEEQDVERAVAGVSASLGQTIELNAGHLRDLTVEIRRIRRRGSLVAAGLDGVCTVVALVAAGLAEGVIRRHSRLALAHQRLLRLRADDLEQFAGRVAHDILSPLAAVGVSLVLVCRSDVPEQRAEALERGQRSLARVKRIVDGMLDFARAGAPPEGGAEADVAVVLRDLATELPAAARDAGADLRFESLPACAVACSPGILTSLVSNLARNAIKYIGEGEIRRITIRALDQGPRVRVEVEDTGPGLPPDLGDDVFEPYVRGRGNLQPGIGLGLATVKRMAQAHGGRVGVRSRPGAGALFWFELPRATRPTA